jgi:opacity protein-like surface antigen
LFGKPDKDTPSAIAASIVVAGFSAIVCGSVASAGRSEDLPEDSYARPGFLLGGSGIYAADTSEGDLESALRKERAAPVNFSLKDSFGFKSQAGYRCHPRFSAEVDVEWLDGFDGSAFENGAGKVATIDFEPVVVTTNLKAYALTGRYQPYALVGGGMMTVKVKTKDALGTDTETATNVAMRFGGGLDFYATEHVVLTLGVDYVLPFGDLEDLDYVSIGWGLRYRF